MNINRIAIASSDAQADVRQEHRWFLFLVLAFFCLALAIINTYYVGDLAIYQDANARSQLAVHDSILNNTTPDGGWSANSMNGVNVRVTAIYLAEAIHDVLRIEVGRAYRLMDLVFVAITFFLAFFFFRSFTSTSSALIGLMYLGCIFPMTYAFHNVHPWDRIGWLTWLLAIWAVKVDRPFALAVVLVVGITIKYDILALAGLYFLVWVDRVNWKRVTATTTVVSLLGIATFALLVYLRPGGFDVERTTSLISRVRLLYWELCGHPISHPALLALTPLILLAPMGFQNRNRFAIMSFLYGIFLLLLVAWSAVFKEIRAQMGIILLLMPLVLIALDRIFRTEYQRRAATTRVAELDSSE